MTATVLLYILGVLLMLTGLAGLILPGLPGAPLIFAGIVAVAWADGFERIGVWGLVLLGAVTLLISAVDYAAGVLGAKRFGASWWGVLGALLGLVAGLPMGLAGLILGPVIGAVALEYFKDPDFEKASRIGFGTFLGFVVGTAVKYALAFFLIGLAVLVYIFPLR